MAPWCSEGDVPTSANLNLSDREDSSVNWHGDDEPLSGSGGDAKLIVSMSFGSISNFKWKAKSCPDSSQQSWWLCHVYLLIMDGQSWSGAAKN